MQVPQSKYFTLPEMIFSGTALRLGLDNTLPLDLYPNMQFLMTQLDVLRGTLNVPLHINSGYRSHEVNKVVNGQPNSDHLLALAADITCHTKTPFDLCIAAYQIDFPWDQIIYEFGAWCHVSFAPAGKTPRRDLLTIRPGSTHYERGIHPF